MILVTGTKRSGTSLWMQLLNAAGLHVVGEAFPDVWGRSIRDANPKGFYESRLRSGIFYATNPDPKTGAFLTPAATKRHVVKVFVPGLVRTDVAYLDRVVATVRHWRDYGPSLRRLQAMEDRYFADRPNPEAVLEKVRSTRSSLPPEIEWFLENYEIVRDVSVRRYPINVSTYEQLLRDPGAVLGKVLPWLGGGDIDKAVAAIDDGVRTQGRERADTPHEHGALFDEFHEAIESSKLSPPLISRLNELRIRLEGEYGKLSPERAREPAE